MTKEKVDTTNADRVKEAIAGIPAETENILILSQLPDGRIDIRPSIPTYGFAHQMVNNAMVDLVFGERNLRAQEQALQEGEIVDVDVEEPQAKEAE